MSGPDRVLHLHQRSLLRIWLVTQVLIQAVFYVALGSMLLGGLSRGDYLVAGVLGLVAVFGLAVVRSYLLLQPPLSLDLDERMIESRSGTLARTRLPFDVAERMELRTGILHQLYLARRDDPDPDSDPDSDSDSDSDREAGVGPRRFRLNLAWGGIRRDDGEHRLADVLPTPLRRLSDGVVAIEKPTWGDAVRLACFVGLVRTWRGRPVETPAT